jgi:hypothetical protein
MEMLNDLTPEEIVALVYLVKSMPDGAMVFVGDTLTPLDSVPGMESLAVKINESGDREDVKKYLDENYG